MKRVAAAILWPFAAIAQPLDSGTVDVYFQQLSREGKLDGCSLVFTSLVNDYMYLNGAQVIMNGSIAVRAMSNKSIAFTAKLGTKPFLRNSPKWDAPVHFYVATKTHSTAGRANFVDGDHEGYRLLITQLDSNFAGMFKEMVETHQFTVGFNRKPGGSDVYTVVKMNVQLTKDANGNAAQVINEETAPQFFDCVGDLAKSISR